MAKAKVSELLAKVPINYRKVITLLATASVGLKDIEKAVLRRGFGNTEGGNGKGGIRKGAATDQSAGSKHPKATSHQLNHQRLEALNKLVLLNRPKESNFGEAYQLLKIYKEHGAEKNFTSGLLQAFKILQRAGNYDHEHYLHMFLLKELEVSAVRGIRKQQGKVMELEACLDTFYLENKLRLLCEKYNRSEIVNKSVEETPFEKKLLIKHIEEKPTLLDIFKNDMILGYSKRN